MKAIPRNRSAVLFLLGTTMLDIASIRPEAMAFSPPAGATKRPPSAEATTTTTTNFPRPQIPAHNRRQHPVSSSSSSSSALGLFSKWYYDETPKELLVASAIGILIAAIGIFDDIFYVVDAGQIGISSTLGKLERRDPGLHTKLPILTNVQTLSTKTQLLEQSNFVPTKEGLTVELDTAVLVKLDPERAVELYRSVGPDFVAKVVTPEASSSVRGLTSESEAKALYTSGRTDLQNRLRDELRDKLGERGVLVEDVLLKNVVLPETLSKSIQEKARAEQESARMEFVLLKENQEAKRKAIEAEGIAEFQRIVSDGITPSMLQWKGIEATQKLANSPNSKVVIVGNSKDSLPVILGNE